MVCCQSTETPIRDMPLLSTPIIRPPTMAPAGFVAKSWIKVGVNEFVDQDGGSVEVLEIPAVLEGEQVGRVRDLRKRRDQATARTALDRLAAAAGTDENLMPFLVDCARAMCTEGEIVGSLRQVFGEYTETPRF